MEDKLRDIFQDKLNNYQAPVDASAWSAVESGIGSAGSSAATGGLLASLGAKIAAIIVLASVGLGVLYFVTKEKQAKSQSEKTANIVVEKQNLEESLPWVDNKPTAKEEKEQLPVKTSKATPTTSTPARHKIPKETIPTKTLPNNASEAMHQEEKQKNTATEPSQTENPETKLPAEEETTPVLEEIGFEIIPLDKEELSFEFTPSSAIPEGMQVLWDFGNGTTSTENAPTVYFDTEGRYDITLTLTAPESPQVVATKKVEAFYPIQWEIQNIFTPNDDLYNQFFDPAAKAQNITIEQVKIFDANQRLMYQSTSNDKKWDGKLPNGELAVQGYYYYQVTATGHDGKSYSKKGKVYLITGR